MKKRDAKRYAYQLAAEILTRNQQSGVVAEDVTDVSVGGYGEREVVMVEAAMSEIIAALEARGDRLYPPGSKGAAACQQKGLGEG
ncbi:MAG: hypothetical protein O7G84_01105 [Gammaproteobacteria bacterium]|nr:hypothetical protein [Gammaproteobacteria bacterium]